MRAWYPQASEPASRGWLGRRTQREVSERYFYDRSKGLFDLHPTVTLYNLMNICLEGESGVATQGTTH